MTRSVCIIQGHPHATGNHLCHALAEAYAEGAAASDATVRRIDIGVTQIDFLRDPAQFAFDPPDAIVAAQKTIRRSDHIVVVYPLWLGTMPALVKAFFEHLCRNSFAIEAGPGDNWPRQMLKGKSARVIVTMGMPAPAYKMFYGAHGVRGFESGILGMAGIKPVRETLIGGVGALTQKRVDALCAKIRKLGERQV